ncbi:AraC family transcriptional regulator [Bacteroidales bacterium OttesenSCG-928-I14]|nr:AraC family transcriptional regulator [Bacteroidales bacterium OttesenSCG-928-I14]
MDRIAKALIYIEQHLFEDIHLKDIANHVGYSREHFCLYFRVNTGVGFWKYISSKRIEKACELLENSEMSVKNIAYYCGFNDSSTFCTVFKRVTGKRPGEIREKGDRR